MRGVRDDGSDGVFGERRKIRENFRDRCALCEAREYGPDSDTRTFYSLRPTANVWISHDICAVLHTKIIMAPSLRSQ